MVIKVVISFDEDDKDTGYYIDNGEDDSDEDENSDESGDVV